jgi:hypothetical protein
MKNFERIIINNEKLLKNYELLSLKGGTEVGTCYGCWGSGGFIGHVYGTGLNMAEATLVCEYSYFPQTITTVFQTECPA